MVSCLNQPSQFWFDSRFMQLPDVAIQNATPRQMPYKMFGSCGLLLVVNPSGSRLWRIKYRGREALLSFGPYPLISLRDARDKRDNARRLLIEGIDSSKARQEERARQLAEAETTVPFGNVA